MATKYKPRDIVYSPRRRSTFILQSQERSGSQWYCYLAADTTTHKPILREKYGCLSPIDCYAWEYDFELVQD